MLARLLNLKWFNFLLFLFFIFLFSLIFIIFYFPNYTKLKDLKYANEQLLKKIEDLKKEIKILEEKNKNNNINELLYEKIAKEDLGMVKEKEIVIDIKE